MAGRCRCRAARSLLQTITSPRRTVIRWTPALKLRAGTVEIPLDGHRRPDPADVPRMRVASTDRRLLVLAVLRPADGRRPACPGVRRAGPGPARAGGAGAG